MKKEILRIQNLNMPYQERRRYHWVSMILFEGECTAFRGLSFSGKDALVKFLTLRSPCNVEDLGLFIDSERILTQRALEEKIYRIAPRSHALRGWTCAEYIALTGSGWILMGRQKKALLQKAQDMADSLGLRLDVRRTLRELSEKEMRLAEIARACMLNARVLVVEDELEGLPEEDIQDLASTLRMTAKKRHLTVIINVNSSAVSAALADHYVIFRDGKIVKKCKKTEIASGQQLEAYMLGPMTDSRRSYETQLTAVHGGYGNERAEQRGDILYRMRSFSCDGYALKQIKGSSLVRQNGPLLDISFLSSGVTALLALNEKLRVSLFMSLSGREMDEQTYCVIGNRQMRSDEYLKFVESRVVSVMHLGSREELFGYMSVGENLVLPSIRKISFSDYLFSSGRLAHAVDPDTAIEGEMSAPVKESDVNSRIAVTLERWYLYNPKVMVMLEPFERCDLYGVSIVRSYIRKLAGRGASVILIMSREEYTEDISDDILRFY